MKRTSEIMKRLPRGRLRPLIPVTALVAATCVSPLLASPKGPNYDGIRSMGMGNTTVAVTTDRTAIFHNPAGLGLIEDRMQMSMRPLVLAIDKMFGDYVRFLIDNSDALSNIDAIDSNFIKDLDDFDGYWSMLQYMPEVTVATKNLGFGMYANFPFNARIESGHFIPKLGFKGQRDLVFTWAVGIPLKNKNNYFGISLEYLQRTPLDERITTFAETFAMSDEIGGNPLATLGLVDQFATVQHGASFDVGFMHNFKGFRIAYDVKDIFGVIGGLMVVPQLDIGCAYYFPFIERVKFIRNLIAAIEISDIIGFEEKTERYEQFPKKLHAGMEIDLKYVALRAGVNQGYPTVGAGIKLGPLSLDYVYYTEEAGYFAGQLARTMHLMSLGFEINVAKKEAAKEKEEPSGVQEEAPPQPAAASPQPAPASATPAAPTAAPAQQEPAAEPEQPAAPKVQTDSTAQESPAP